MEKHEVARRNMVEQQIKPQGVYDERILKLLAAYKREDFVPAAYQQIAYADACIPLGNHRVLLEPSIIGRMLQKLNLMGFEQILEIGTGTGYITALLAELGQHVTSIEHLKPLAVQANKRLSELGLKNYEIITGDANELLQSSKAFDVIVLTGSVPYLPKLFSDQLKFGGRLFAIVGQSPVMHACIFTRINDEEWLKDALFETNIPRLKEIVDATTFEF